jgi:Tfp pilus assembly protein PilV
MPPVDGPSDESGFSLLEAIVSFAILALALSATFGAGTLGLHASHRAKLQTEALLEAQSLTSRIGVDMPIAQNSYTGETALGHFYRIDIVADRDETAASAESEPQPHHIGYAITTNILAKPSDKQPLVSLHSFKMVARDDSH